MDVFHRQKVSVIDLAEVKDLDDVLMGQRHRDLRFVQKHRNQLNVGSKFRADPLYDQVFRKAIDTGGARQKYFAHAPSRELMYELISTVLLHRLSTKIYAH